MRKVPDWLVRVHELVLERELTGPVTIHFTKGQLRKIELGETLGADSPILRMQPDTSNEVQERQPAIS